MTYASEFNLTRPIDQLKDGGHRVFATSPAVHVPKHLAVKLESIHWVFVAPERGYVFVKTQHSYTLDKDECTSISEWIADLCRGGLFEPLTTLDYKHDKYEVVPFEDIDPADADNLIQILSA